MQKVNTLLFVLLFLVHIVQGQNQNISNGNVFEGEPFLAVNPANPQNLVVAWMGFVLSSGVRPQIKTRSSYDGGNTWSDIVIMPHIQNTYQSADPTMAFDENGNHWAMPRLPSSMTATLVDCTTVMRSSLCRLYAAE